MGFKVVNTIHIPGVDFGEKLLTPLGAELINAPSKTEEDLISATADADAVVCSGPVQPWSARVLESMKKCRIVASLGVGYDRVDLDTATRMGMVVTNVPDYCIDEVAGHTIALMLAVGRKLFAIDSAVRSRNTHFVPPNRNAVEEILFPIKRLQDSTVGVVGFGRIGTATAMKARGLGMQVIAYDPYVYDAVMESHGVRPVDFATLLSESDYICINAALTDETRLLFDKAAFAAMKPSAFLINTARGEMVDEAALIEALEQNRIAGAGLDVTWNDPVKSDDPLLNAPNVLLTGHSAWYATVSDSGPGFWYRAVDQVVSALQGIWPTYAVNREVKLEWLKRWGG